MMHETIRRMAPAVSLLAPACFYAKTANSQDLDAYSLYALQNIPRIVSVEYFETKHFTNLKIPYHISVLSLDLEKLKRYASLHASLERAIYRHAMNSLFLTLSTRVINRSDASLAFGNLAVKRLSQIANKYSLSNQFTYIISKSEIVNRDFYKSCDNIFEQLHVSKECEKHKNESMEDYFNFVYNPRPERYKYFIVVRVKNE